MYKIMYTLKLGFEWIKKGTKLIVKDSVVSRIQPNKFQ